MGLFKRKPKEQPKPKAKKSNSDIYSFLSGFAGDSTENLQQYIDEFAIPKKAPVPKGHAQDSACQTPVQVSFESVNPVLLAHFVATGQFIGYPAMAIMSQNWLIRKGCESKPRDAVRNWYEIESEGQELTPEQIKKIQTLDRKYNLKNNIIEGCTFNNIFGIRHILFKNTDKNFDYEKPFNPDEFKGGKYAGIAQIDPMRVTPVFDNEDLMNPMSMNYLEPTWWQVNGKKIHKSHMIILRGHMVADILKPTYRYGGVSKVQEVYERVYAAERTANEAPQLALTKRLTWRKADIEKVAANPNKFARAMNKLAEFRNNFGIQLVGKDEEVGQLETSLADFDKTVMNQYQLVCSIFDEPASKLMGTGHQGFSTGEADIDYRIETLEELQANEMTDIVLAHYRRLVPSAAGDLGINPDANLSPDWLPLRVMSDAQIAEVNLKNRQADQIIYQSQAIDNYELRQRLINDPYSGYDNLAMPEDEDTDDIEETTESKADGNNKQQQALNGAQIASLADLSFKVKSGEIDEDAAVEIIMMGFPASKEQAQKIVKANIGDIDVEAQTTESQ